MPRHIVGLGFALLGVGLTIITGDPLFDSIGTLFIGALLIAVALILGIETKSLLLGEGASPENLATIRDAFNAHPTVESLIHMKTLYLGPDELMIAAKVAFPEGDAAGRDRDGDRRARGGHPRQDPRRPSDLHRARPVPPAGRGKPADRRHRHQGKRLDEDSSATRPPSPPWSRRHDHRQRCDRARRPPRQRNVRRGVRGLATQHQPQARRRHLLRGWRRTACRRSDQRPRQHSPGRQRQRRRRRRERSASAART